MGDLGKICIPLLLNGMDAILECAANLGAPPRRGLALKDVFYLLEGLPGRLRVEEEDMDGHDGAEGAKYHVRLPGYVRESWRDEQRQGQIEDPVSSSGDTDTLGSVLQGEDFGGVDPAHRSLLWVRSVRQILKAGAVQDRRL